jgi:hypothetical protein
MECDQDYRHGALQPHSCRVIDFTPFVVPVLIVIPLLGEEHGRRNGYRQQQRKQPTQNREQNGMMWLPKRRGDPGTETHSAPEFAERT